MSSYRNYYEQRYEEERAAAEQARSLGARIAHLDLAVRYAIRAAQSDLPSPETPLSVAEA